MGTLRRGVLGISRRETTFEKRGFPPCPDAPRDHLEKVGATFIDGYHAALTWDVTPALHATLEETGSERCGFAYEGAAMALALLDALTPWRRDRIEGFLEGPGDDHVYMIHVGIGFALARLKRRAEPTMESLHPLYRWLVIDGYGFHEGFFKWRDSFERRHVPERLSPEARPMFDQGLGRSLWFVAGAQADRIEAMIQSFPEERRSDLWSGIGLASTYAGGCDAATLKRLRSYATAAGAAADLAQGAAFAAKARERAGNLMPHTESACGIYCGRSAAEAAKWTDDALSKVSTNGAAASYQMWRHRVRESAA